MRDAKNQSVFQVLFHQSERRRRLIFILGLLACALGTEIYVNYSHGYNASDAYAVTVVVLMALFTYLAYGGFEWSQRVGRVVRMLAWSCIAFGSVYIAYIWAIALRGGARQTH